MTPAEETLNELTRSKVILRFESYKGQIKKLEKKVSHMRTEANIMTDHIEHCESENRSLKAQIDTLLSDNAFRVNNYEQQIKLYQDRVKVSDDLGLALKKQLEQELSDHEKAEESNRELRLVAETQSKVIQQKEAQYNDLMEFIQNNMGKRDFKSLLKNHINGDSNEEIDQEPVPAPSKRKTSESATQDHVFKEPYPVNRQNPISKRRKMVNVTTSGL